MSAVFTEDDLLPISALQHLLYCERRAALHHTEGIWLDNVFTAEGTAFHSRVHSVMTTEARGDIRITRGLRLRSLRLGLVGVSDVVEFHRVDDNGVTLAGVLGLWRPYAVEYKRGRLRHEVGYEVQLCAQALCLEEMLDTHIIGGAIYYGKTKRRLDIVFDDRLRVQTEQAAARLHALIESQQTPSARYEKKCDKCSLLPLCIPKTVSSRQRVGRYIDSVFTSMRG